MSQMSFLALSDHYMTLDAKFKDTLVEISANLCLGMNSSPC